MQGGAFHPSAVIRRYGQCPGPGDRSSGKSDAVIAMRHDDGDPGGSPGRSYSAASLCAPGGGSRTGLPNSISNPSFSTSFTTASETVWLPALAA